MRARVMINRHVELCLWMLAILLAALLVLGMARPATGVAGAAGRVVDTPPQATIVSPCEGYFLVAEYPGGTPLVQVGSVVTTNTTVGYVQSMDRAPTPVLARMNGTIVAAMFDDMAPVGMGDALFRVQLHK